VGATTVYVGKSLLCLCEILHSVETEYSTFGRDELVAAKLVDLGFSEGTIAETIVSTYNTDGTANAAPMGAKLHNQNQLQLALYVGSKTLQNLKTQRCAVVNLTSDIEVFYKTTFKEANPQSKLTQDWFTNAVSVHAPKLRQADATLEVSVENLEANGEKTTANLHVELVEAEKKYPQAPCRASALTLEAIIHATRVKAFINQPSEQAQVAKLIDTIRCYGDVVNRVAPGSSYQRVMVDLQKRIASWRTTQ
jgi:hypothetical protein